MTLEHEGTRGNSTPPPQTGGTGTVFPPRGALRNTETVINVERRPTTDSSLELPNPSSTICNVLFPNPEAFQQAFPSPHGIELGHFRIETAIRSGGMGAVFEALDTRLNRTVALKILPPSLSRDASSIQRFRNEAQAAAQLDHDNIARVYFIGEDKGLHFIAFEYIRGTNLREIVQQRGRLSPSEAVNYTLQVASAIAHASAHGVVHRDIKPSNIIITPSGRAKLVDLGLARSEHRDNEPDLTVAGTTLGTFDYISPEQAKDPRAVDVRSDIYSLGCTLYHLLTGEPPYPQGTVLQKLLDHQGKEPPDPRLKNRKVTPELAAIIRMMMSSDPRRRYQTAEILIRDLLVVANSLGLRSVSTEGLMWLSAQKSPDTFWERHASWLATAVGLLLIVGYLQFGLQTRDNTPHFGVDEGLTNAFETSEEGLPSGFKPGQSEIVGASGTSPRNNLENGSSTSNPGRTATEPDKISDSVSIPGDTSTVETVSNIKSPAQGTLTEPGNLFNNPLSQEIFSPIPLIDQVPAGVVYGPEFNPELVAAIGAKSTPALRPVPEMPETGVPIPPIPGGSETISPPAPPGPTVAVVPQDTLTKTPSDLVAQSPIVVLKSDGSPEQSYPTLEAACAGAQDGNVIELRFNGPRIESPLRIRSKITIRAAKGFKPVIEFVPKEIPAAGYETRMMTISGGSLDLVEVNLLLKVRPSISTDLWALLSAQRSEAIRFQRVQITVENTAQRPAAVVEFRQGAARMLTDMEMMSGGQLAGAMTVLLKDSMVRGGTDLFLVRSILSARIDLDNSLLALDGTLLRAQGAVDAPEKQTELSLRLNQLTAALNSGLIVMDGGESPRKLGRVSIEATNNIFTRDPSPEHQVPPFISMLSNEPQDDLLKLLAWNGQKNFYDGFDAFLTRTTPDGSKSSVWDYEEWKFRWDSHEIDPNSSIVLWKKRWSDKIFSETNPADFELDETATGNPALSAANDGGNAGVDLSRLSRLTAPSSADSASLAIPLRTGQLP